MSMCGHAMLDNWLESLDARRIGGMRRSHDAASERVAAIGGADRCRVETLEQSDGNGSGDIDVALHLGDNGVGSDGRLADVPAVVVGDETDGRVANLSLTSKLGLGQTGHADDRRVNEAVEIRLGARGKRGTLHADIGATVESRDASLGAKLVRNAVNVFTQLRADRIAKGHVRDEAGLVEKRVILLQPVEILVNDNNVATVAQAKKNKKKSKLGGKRAEEVARFAVFFQAADRCDGDDSIHAQRFQREYVGAMWHVRRRN